MPEHLVSNLLCDSNRLQQLTGMRIAPHIPQVAFDEAALSQADGMWSSGAAVVLGSLCDAMATRAVSSWLDTARDWVSFAITVFSGNSKET